ncbi:MAG: hypothetical protein ABI895_29340 [Deltaproteobacteria bacterium]
MGFKPPVAAGKSYRVQYDAALSSGGPTLVRVIWIPRHGRPVPEPEHVMVVPGASGSIEDKVPSASSCRWLEIWVDLPDGTGRGTLTLKVDDRDHSREDLDADTLWTSLVLG